jgi:lysophospholipase L1-like esterase
MALTKNSSMKIAAPARREFLKLSAAFAAFGTLQACGGQGGGASQSGTGSTSTTGSTGSTGTTGSTGSGSTTSSTSGVWRAMGQGMQAFPAGANAPTGLYSVLSRVRSYSNSRFRYFRVVMPLFWVEQGPPIADAAFAQPLNFQVGIEYPFTPALTGIPGKRTTVTWSGKTTLSSDGTGYYAISDVMDMGSIVPAGTYFGVWTAQENASGPGRTTTYGGLVPSNFMPDRYVGFQSSASASFIETNAVATATSVEGATSSQGGGGYLMTPAFFLVEDLDNKASVVLLGDSIMYGVGEGDSGSGSFGDSLGSQQANGGWAARWVDEELGLNHVNFSRGADAFQYLTDSNNWPGRQALLSIVQATHVLCGHGHNDLANPITKIVADAGSTYSLIRSSMGSKIPIIQSCMTPYSDSTDDWAMTTSQAAFALTIRAQLDSDIQTLGLGNVGYVDLEPLLEAGYTEESPSSGSGLWIANGAPFGYTIDGRHPNSQGHYTGAGQGGTLPFASLNGAAVTNPFSL